jgi:hypothetical protein
MLPTTLLSQARRCPYDSLQEISQEEKERSSLRCFLRFVRAKKVMHVVLKSFPNAYRLSNLSSQMIYQMYAPVQA